MALKGKKKSRSRGSQARRRPASAPRPTPVARRRPPWYRTTGGRIIGALVAVVVISLIAWTVTNQRNDARELEATQDAMDTYTGQVRTVLQALTSPVGEMATADSLPIDELAAKAKSWDQGFSAAQTALSQTNPPPELQPVNALLLRSILMYVQAADTYELAPEVTGPARAKLLRQGGVQVQNADGVFAGAISVLDAARVDAELRASGIESPSAAAPPAGPAAPDVGADGAEVESSTGEIEVGEPAGSGGGGTGAKGGKKDGEKGDG